MYYIKLFLVAFISFIAVDLVWLGIVAKNLYRQQIGHLMADSPNWYAAIVFYILFVIGLIIFSIHPAIGKESLNHAMIYGALFGFFAYVTFDMTSLATLKDWPLTITIIDMAWGTFLGFSVSTLSYLIFTKWLM